MKVVPLPEWKNRETVAALQQLLELAQRGEITGIAVCAKMKAGDERAMFSGRYRSNPAEGVNAAMRLSWALTQAQDRLVGPP